jgi:hypothetical protein
MKTKPNYIAESYRVKTGQYGSDSSIGNNGVFEFIRAGRLYYVIISDEYGWDHVSISSVKRTPSWETMCWIKGLFFDDTETVIQLHPPKSDHINHHEHCLHLWRNQNEDFKLPPTFMV